MVKRIGIIGAGPIGIEAGVRAMEEGYEVVVFEKGRVGEHVRRWKHVELFSPWEMNRSRWGAARLGGGEGNVGGGAEFPTGEQYLEHYLIPLADRLGEGLQEGTEVLGASRRGQLKGEGVGQRDRDAGFELRVRGEQGERFEEVDILLDASGVLSQPGRLGPQGLSALGEEEFEERILRGIPEGEQIERWGSRDTVMLVGAGHSAMTSLKMMVKALGPMKDEAPRVWWAYRELGEPRELIDGDPLPQRAQLDELGNRAARQEIDGVVALDGSQVRSIKGGQKGAMRVEISRRGGLDVVGVDWIVSNVGYRPDLSLTRELQVHHCYASEGPMKLAAHLMASAGGGGNCLEQSSGGAETLETPEPDFFVLGAKSFGRNSNFLLSLGFEQIDQVFDELLQR